MLCKKIDGSVAKTKILEIIYSTSTKMSFIIKNDRGEFLANPKTEYSVILEFSSA